ncbi:hypothetical protein HPB50_025739 [Hyalomma asiaticum]|uniref:Uncharacterized protein n=1 Tax=Hyalomma asiaticum TaxID=266040 RepID=A0ACB7TR59_HYAAI|nr:hypothetical protein HPB50_025739 [Hyalomma asiaticum]
MGTERQQRAWVGVQAQLSKTVGPGTPRGQNGDADDQAAEHVSSTHGPPPPPLASAAAGRPDGAATCGSDPRVNAWGRPKTGRTRTCEQKRARRARSFLYTLYTPATTIGLRNVRWNYLYLLRPPFTRSSVLSQPPQQLLLLLTRRLQGDISFKAVESPGVHTTSHRFRQQRDNAKAKKQYTANCFRRAAFVSSGLPAAKRCQPLLPARVASLFRKTADIDSSLWANGPSWYNVPATPSFSLSFCAARALLRNPCRPPPRRLAPPLFGAMPAFPKGDSTPLPEMSNPGRSHVVVAVNARTLRPWAEPPQTRVAHDSFGAYANARAMPVCPARPLPPPCSFSSARLVFLYSVLRNLLVTACDESRQPLAAL